MWGVKVWEWSTSGEAYAKGNALCMRMLLCVTARLLLSLSSSLHYDPNENLLCVVCGSKIVRLYPPAVTPFLYPR